MALTLVSRETFQGVGTLNAASPGNLGTIYTGAGNQQNFYKRAVGPRLTSDTTADSKGWSADTRQVGGSATIIRHDVTTTATAAATLGFFSGWYRFNSFANSGGQKQYISSAYVSNGNQLIQMLMDSTTGNFWYNRNGLWADTDSGVAVPVRQWFELRIAWQNTTGTTYNLDVAYRLAGSGSWVTIYTAPSAFNAGAAISTIRGCAPNTAASTGTFVGRYGMPSLYGIASWSERTSLISDVADPLATATTWYVNPLIGNDNNDGVTSASAWQTAPKVNTENTNGGFFAAITYEAGDTLVIDTSGASLDVTSAGLTIQTRGLNVRAATGQTWATLIPYKTLSAGGFTGPIAGTTKVYQTSDVIALTTFWEDDKWLNHPVGANLAAVQATLESTPGSFWINAAGTIGYLHPFGDTDPRSDGKVYTRTHIGTTTAAVNLNAGNLNIQDLDITKTCDVDPATNLPNAGYGIGTGGLWAGTNIIKHCRTNYFGKHGLGLVANSAAGEDTTIDGCIAEQGSPYGSQTPFVSFNGTSVTNLTHRYIRCVSLKDSGLIGSTAGVSGPAQSIYSHNTSGSNQFALISVEDCNFADSSIGVTNAVVTLTINKTIFGGENSSGAQFKTVTNSRWNKYVPSQNRSDGVMTIRNNLIVPVLANYADGSGAIIGTGVIEANVFDFSNATLAAATVSGILTRTGASTVTFRNNIVIFPVATGGGNTFSIFKNFVNTDTLVSTNNAVFLNGSTWAKSYNDGSTTADRTFAQWQTLGFDANSQSVTNLLLGSDYKPQKGSPVIKAGVNIGPLTDYAGLKTFPVRDTIGAYQFSGTPVFVRRGGRTVLGGFQ